MTQTWKDGDTITADILNSDASIAPQQIATTVVPKSKIGNTYDKISKSSDLYILNSPIMNKGIINVVGKFASGQVYIYFLKKDNDTYTVIDKTNQTMKDGWQTIITSFYAKGDGSEYVGVIGSTYYSESGGDGFLNVSSADKDASYYSTHQLIANYDFSIFNSVMDGKLVEKIENQTINIENRTMMSNFDDGRKDFSVYTDTSLSKNYVYNKTLNNGNVTIHIASALNQTGKLYIVEKNGLDFTVKKSKTINFVVGENIVDMEYETSGNGNEYIGYFGKMYFTKTGGAGFFESPANGTNSYNDGDTFTALDQTTSTASGKNYDFAIYAEYKRTLVEETSNIKNKIANSVNTLNIENFKTPRYTEISDSVGFVGRWFDTTVNGTPVKATINEGAELYFKVKGTTTVNINFIMNSVKATPFFAYSIDGGVFTRQLITSPTLPTITTDEHVIRVVIDGLTESEDKWVGEKGIAFEDITVDEGGKIIGILPKNRKIMFFGDSITEGIRVLNMNADSNGNSATGAFPFIASEKLNAISYRVGFGATGATKGGSGGVPKLLSFINNMTSSRQSPYYEPDLVVVNIGTNDKTAAASLYISELNKALDSLTIKYSGTPLFVMIPFDQGVATSVKNVVYGRENVYLVDTKGWNITTTDGTHPDVSGSIIAGNKLSDYIVSVLGQNYFI